MKRFILNTIRFFGILLLAAIPPSLLYLKREVYCDFGNHRNYSWKYNFQGLGDISTKKLINSSIPYNSFVFGSSRCVELYACYLNKKVKDARFFHYANWYETIGGIYAKLKLLDSLKYSINNVIIYIDADGTTFNEDGKILPSEHYLLTHQSQADYYFMHYKMFFSSLDVDKLKILLGMKVSGMVFPNWESDLTTNDHRHICTNKIPEDYVNTEMDEAYLHRIDSLKQTGILYKRSAIAPAVKEKQISEAEVNILSKIKQLFIKHKTHYYVVITPLYDQLKFNDSDLHILREFFGNHLFDFSGVNDITNNEYNYLDGLHFRPCISKQMVDSILDQKRGDEFQADKTKIHHLIAREN